MGKEEAFYKRCPTKDCNTISGFCLTQSKINKDKKYCCQNCEEENELSKWKEVNKSAYECQNDMRGNSNFYR